MSDTKSHLFPRRHTKRRRDMDVNAYLDWMEWRRLEVRRDKDDMRPETWRRRGGGS